MNCTMRKMKKASVARNFGRARGQNVSTRPSWLKMVYCGISTTCAGSMMVASMNANSGPRSRNRSRANAKAASVHEMRLPSTDRPATATELKKNRHTDTPPDSDIAST
jgi:hypothetical protein